MKVELSLQIADKMYKSSDKDIRNFATAAYPELLEPIINRVKTFEDACRIKGVDPNQKYFTLKSLNPKIVVTRKLELITEVLNEVEDTIFFDKAIFSCNPFFPLSACWYAAHPEEIFLSLQYDFFDRSVFKDTLLFIEDKVSEYAAEQFKDLYLEYLSFQDRRSVYKNQKTFNWEDYKI